MNKFFEFHQNNSGGFFSGPALIIVEAESAEEANDIAEQDGEVYFGGVSLGRDCECCGDRWHPCYGEGSDQPESYGSPVEEGENVRIIRKVVDNGN